jgi:MFS family permease
MDAPSSSIRDVVRRHRLLLTSAAIDAIGTGFMVPITVLYFTLDRGFSVVGVGVGLSIAGAVSILAPSLGGIATDRLGARPVAVTLFLVTAAAFLLYIPATHYWEFVAVVTLAEVADRMARPAKQALVANVTEGSERMRLLAVQRALRNAGFGAGGALAALALAAGTHGAYVALIVGNAASWALAGALLARLRVPATTHEEEAEEAAPIRFLDVVRDYRYVVLALLNMVILLHASVLEVAMPLWVVRETAAPRAVAPILFTLNTGLVVAMQVVASRASDSVARARRAYAWAAGALVGMCALFAAAAHVQIAIALLFLVAAVVLLSLGEVLATAAEWGVSFGLAPAAARGRYLAVFQTATAMQTAFGPALVTALLFGLHGRGWALLALVFLGAGSAAFTVGRTAREPQAVPA